MGEHWDRQIDAEDHEDKPVVSVFAAEHDVVEDGFRGESQELRIAHDERLPEIHENNPADCRHKQLHEALFKEGFGVVFFAVAEQGGAGNHDKNRDSIAEKNLRYDVECPASIRFVKVRAKVVVQKDNAQNRQYIEDVNIRVAFFCFLHLHASIIAERSIFRAVAS